MLKKKEVKTKEKYNCECLKCHHKLTSDKHCRDIKCPKCGGEMRRVERPGAGAPEKRKKEGIKDMENKNNHEILDVYFAPCITEEKDGSFFMRGMFAEADVKNQNNRIYPLSILEAAIEDFKENTLTGMDGHPSLFSSGSYRDIAMKFEKVWTVDKKAYCKVKILDTAAGKDLKIIAQENIPVGLSMRGYGDEKYDEKLKVNVVQEGYKLAGIDAVLEPAFEQAKVIREQKSKEGGENMDELKKQIVELSEAIKNIGTEIQQLKKKDTTLSEENTNLLKELKAENEKNKNLLEAKQEVKKILESDKYKDHEFKEQLRLQLEKCESVDMVNKTLPLILDTLDKFKGISTKPEPTSVIISSGKGFFGADKHPNTMEEGYKWCLDKFEDTGIWQGKSRLDNPRYKASVMLENFLKLYMGGGNDQAAETIPRASLFKKNRRNPLYHILRETIGDDEMASTDVTALAGYLLPLYVTTMKDMMNIVNPAIGVLPIPKPTAVIPFKKSYYWVSTGVWAEINPTNFTRIKAVSSEGGTPLKMKIKTLTNNIALKDPLALQYEWTIEAQQDLMAYYGMNVDSDTLQEARNEIMRELSEQILYALLTAGSFSNSDNCVQATSSPLTYNLVNPQGYSKAEWMKYGLTKAVKQADALINKQPHNVKADTIIVDAAYDFLFTEPHFVSEDKILTSFGFNRIGTYQAHYKVYTTTCVDYAKKIVLLHRGSRITEAPHLYMPYVLFWIGGVVEQATAEFSRTVKSRFATEKVYGQKIAIIDIV